MFQNILFETGENFASIVINRPDKLNALDRQTLEELEQALSEAAGNRNIRAMMITGSGEKAFIAGADIGEIAALNRETAHAFSRQGHTVLARIEQMHVPVIAAVNGFALGGGCELALACHIRIASENARFGQPEVGLGIIPGFGGTQRLPRLVGKGMAMELCLTGRIIDAHEAMRIGLVNRITTIGNLTSETLEMIRTIGQKGPQAVRMVIESINQGMEMPLAKALRLESENFSSTCGSDEMKEGTGAFLEKRSPKFTAG